MRRVAGDMSPRSRFERLVAEPCPQALVTVLEALHELGAVGVVINREANSIVTANRDVTWRIDQEIQEIPLEIEQPHAAAAVTSPAMRRAISSSSSRS